MRRELRRRILSLWALFTLFQKGESQHDGAVAPADQEEDARPRRIRCPQCRWRPSAGSRWMCGPCADPELFFGGCGTAWNTFDTGGVCPGCGHAWQYTACPRCDEWSLHKDWYEARAGRRGR